MRRSIFQNITLVFSSLRIIFAIVFTVSAGVLQRFSLQVFHINITIDCE